MSSGRTFFYPQKCNKTKVGHRDRLRCLTIFWATIVTFCSSSAILADKLFGFDPESTAWAAVASILPILLLLSILNLLPLIFQTIARFYERLKSHSEVDLSVVERFSDFNS